VILVGKDTDRFWSGVDIRGESECWLWRRSCHQRGYGHFKLSGKVERAHRVSWTLANGQIPELFEGFSSHE